MFVSGTHWYLARTQTHAETKAAINLKRQGFATYLPRYLKRRRHARRVETVTAPLFPGYLFVAIDAATQRWRAINSTIGISHLVCFGDEPAIVPDQVIDELQSSETVDGLIELHKPKYAVGDKVRVRYGVFAYSCALFEEMIDSKRVTVLLDLLGQKVRVTMTADAIESA